MKKLRKLLTLSLSACMFVATLAASVPQLTQIAHAVSNYTISSVTASPNVVAYNSDDIITLTATATESSSSTPKANLFRWDVDTSHQAYFVDDSGNALAGSLKYSLDDTPTTNNGISTVKIKLENNNTASIKDINIQVQAAYEDPSISSIGWSEPRYVRIKQNANTGSTSGDPALADTYGLKFTKITGYTQTFDNTNGVYTYAYNATTKGDIDVSATILKNTSAQDGTVKWAKNGTETGFSVTDAGMLTIADSVKANDSCTLTATMTMGTTTKTTTLKVTYKPTVATAKVELTKLIGGADTDTAIKYTVTVGDNPIALPSAKITVTAKDANGATLNVDEVNNKKNDIFISIPAKLAKEGNVFTVTYSDPGVAEGSATYAVSGKYTLTVQGVTNNGTTSTIHFDVVDSSGKSVALDSNAVIKLLDDKNQEISSLLYTVDKAGRTITFTNPEYGKTYKVVYTNALDSQTTSNTVSVTNKSIILYSDGKEVSGGVYGQENKVDVYTYVDGKSYTPIAGQVYVMDSAGKTRSECFFNYLSSPQTITFPRTVEAGTYYVCFNNESGTVVRTPYLISGSDAFTGGFNVSSANLDIANAGKSVAFKIYVYNKGNTEVDYSKVSGNAYITGSSNITLASTNVTVLATGAYITVNLGRNLTAGETAKVNINLYYDNMRVYENAGLSRFQYLNISTFFNGSYANTDVNSTIDTTSSNVVTTAERGKTATDSLLTVKSDGGAKVLAFNGTRRTEIEAVIPATVKIGNETLLVTSISAQAFKGNKVIKRVFIPSTVTKIGKGAFRGAKRIKKIVIAVDDAYDLEIAKNAFRDLTKDTKVIIYSWDTEDYYRTIEKIKKAGGHNLKFVRKNMSNYE